MPFNSHAAKEYDEMVKRQIAGYDYKSEFDYKNIKFKIVNLKEKIEEIISFKVSSANIISAYKEKLLERYAIHGINTEDKDNGKLYLNEYDIIGLITDFAIEREWEKRFTNDTEDIELKKAVDIAERIAALIAAMFYSKELNIQDNFLSHIIEFKTFIKELNNPYIKESLFIDGSGWVSIFKTYSWGLPLENARLAALITLISDSELISNAHNQNWLIPHFDLQAGLGNEVLYEELVMAYKYNDIIIGEKEDVDKCLEYFMKLSHSLTFEKICKIKEIVKKNMG